MADILGYGTANCSLRRALDLVGEKWTLQIIRDTANGVHRFDELQRHVGLSAAVLSDRLRTLVRHGVLETRTYREQGSRARREYRLTEQGWALLPALVALMQWGDRYLFDGEAAPMALTHRDCGAPVHLGLECEAGHHLAGARDVRPIPAPA